MAFDPVQGQAVLFGGETFTSGSGGTIFGILGDTWIWDGSNFTRQSPPTSPPAEFSMSMAYDSARRQIFMSSGFIQPPPSPLANANGTWVWDGKSWTQKSPQSTPVGRAGAVMAYDAAHGQVVLFGGSSFTPNSSGFGGTSTPLNDTWVWDGVNWTQKSPKSSPAARRDAVMAYDGAHGQVVLFGGFSVNPSTFASTTFGDTWIWDGTNWTQQSPMSSPSARSASGMAYDAAHGEIVLVGGADAATNVQNDTWVWNGSNWAKQTPQTNPPLVGSFGIAYDSVHSQTLIFGGLDSTGNDTNGLWALSLGGVLRPVINNVVSASGFGGFSAASAGDWVEIYGANFAASPQTWAGSDFNGNNAPTSLGGVQVHIDGQSAYVEYISSGQINVQLPSGIPSGISQITVTNGNGTSDPYYLTMNGVTPGLLAPPAFNIGGKQYVVAQFSDGTYVLPPGAIQGVASRQAKPGETVVIYGVGFGNVSPGIPAGQIETQMNQLALPFQMSFGQTQAQVPYFGLAPNFVGLYQFNVVVPAVAANDLVPLTFALNSVAGTQSLYIAVGQ